MEPNTSPTRFCKNIARYGRLFLTAITPLVALVSVDAASITWGIPQTITNAAADVETVGVLIHAIDASNGGDGSSSVTVTGKNGVDVQFLSYGAADAESIAGFSSKFRNNANFGGGSSDYGGIVDDGFWQGGESIDGQTTAFSTDTVVVSNLMIGQEYLIQYWAQDAGRDPGFVTVLDGAMNVVLDSNDVTYSQSGQFVVGTFTADATTQSISVAGTLNGANNWGRAQLNAIQLRNINNAVIGWQIEAENYTGQYGTRLETTSDTDGGQNLAYISNNDWIRFDNLSLGDNALLNFRVARNSGTDASHIEVRQGSTTGPLLAQIDVPETGGWQNWETISIQAAPVVGPQDIYLVFVETSTTNNGSLFNLNWWSKTPMVEVEDYTAAAGQRFETTQDIGGGQNLGWITDGEWIEYTIEPQVAGWHKFDFRVAADNPDGYINIVSGGQTIGTVDIGSTGGWQSWLIESLVIELPTAGSQTLRFEFVIPSAGFNLNWFSYEPAPEPAPPLSITVGNTPKQKMRYGIDYERLWYWTGTNAQKDLIAEWSVADADVDYVRVAMNAKYELDEGVFDLNAYTGDGGYPSNDRIIPMMQDMQAANPDVKFFASPRPLNEAHNAIPVGKNDIPWQPYPIWVTGAPSYTSGSYNFNDIKCAEYMVKYLLLMKQYGFKISYMDVSNEWQSNVGGGRVTQDDMDDIHNYLHVTYMADPWEHPDYPGVTLTPSDIPQLVAPSSWNYSQGDSWVDNLDSGDKEAISIVASHNTDRSGTAQDVVDAVTAKFNQPGDTIPEVWNTEVHGWKSTSNADEVLTYAYMLECINAGFSGLNGWLARGTSSQGHSYFDGATPTVKYHMFKKLTTTSNRGYALDVTEPDELKVYWDPDPDQADADSAVSALIRGNLMTVWILNHSNKDYPITIHPAGRTISDEPIQSTRWSQFDGLSSEGITASITKESDTSFTATAKDNSAYCFEILLEPESGEYVRIEAESYHSSSPVSHSTEATSDQGAGQNLSNINDGNWTSYQNINLSEATNIRFRISAATGSPDGEIEIRTNSQAGTLIGRTAIPATGGLQEWLTIEAPLDATTGTHDLYLVYTEAGSNQNGTGAMFNLNWFELITSESVPVPPTGLTATADGTSEIDLAWNTVSGATSYRVLRSTSSGGTYTEIENAVATTSTSDATASTGVPYFYVVRAVNDNGESADSNTATATLQLVAPTNLTATVNGSTQIDLAWSAVSGATRATRYRVLRATSPDGPYTEIDSSLATTSTSDLTASNGVFYYYVVRAVNNTLESADSNVATATLPFVTPTNLTATANGLNQIDLAWNAVSEASGYNVLRATSSSGPYTQIASGLTTTFTSDFSASNGVPYYYVVRAVNGGLASANSNQATATLPLEQPTGLTAINITSSQIDLSWSPLTGATSYTLWRSSIRSRGPYEVIATGLDSTNHSDMAGLIAGTTYYYRVSGSNGVVSSPNSSVISVVALEPIILEDIIMDSTSVDLINNSFSFSLHNSVIGHLYQAEKRRDLMIGDWIDVGDAQPGTGGTLPFVIPILATETEFFYRVNITHQP